MKKQYTRIIGPVLFIHVRKKENIDLIDKGLFRNKTGVFYPMYRLKFSEGTS